MNGQFFFPLLLSVLDLPLEFVVCLVSNADNIVQQNFPFQIKFYAILTIIN